MRKDVVCILAIVVGWWTACACAEHPQDGPHADIRILIDESGVHLGMLINLAFIDDAMPFDRESPDAVHQVEEPALREAIERHIREQNVVAIDGVEIEPEVLDFEMIRPGLDMLPLFPRSGMRGLLRARVDVIYRAGSMPKSVRFVWAGYPPDVLAEVAEGEPRPPLVVEAQLVAEGRVDILTFKSHEPEVTWHGTGLTREERFARVPEVESRGGVRVPMLWVLSSAAGLGVGLLGLRRKGLERLRVVAIGVAVLVVAPLTRSWGVLDLGGGGAALPTEAEARSIFAPLHANIYRAFDYETQSEIYDALARSVDGELLEALYDQIYRSLIMYEEGGAISRVSGLRLLENEVLSIGQVEQDVPGFSVRAKWQVDGVVYHFGHSHRRTNEYLAEYSVIKGEDGWRIAGHRVLAQDRLEPVEPERPARPALPEGEI